MIEKHGTAFALIALGLIGLFPPRSAVVAFSKTTMNDGVITVSPVPRKDYYPHRKVSRGFFPATFLPKKMINKIDPWQRLGFLHFNYATLEGLDARCEIDTGRMMCECLLVGLVSGCIIFRRARARDA